MKERTYRWKRVEKIGDIFGLWKVINTKRFYFKNYSYLTCQCECGVIQKVNIKNLRSGSSKSCGCVNIKKIIDRNTKHNRRFTREWRIWQAMKTRCSNKNIIQYKNYGGRGIKVCDEWKNDFMSFYKDMGESPIGSSIERIDNNGNYYKGNCRWATPKEQTRNKSNNHKINGICITDIDRSLGGNAGLVFKRLKRGWLIKNAITLKSNANF